MENPDYLPMESTPDPPGDQQSERDDSDVNVPPSTAVQTDPIVAQEEKENDKDETDDDETLSKDQQIFYLHGHLETAKKETRDKEHEIRRLKGTIQYLKGDFQEEKEIQKRIYENIQVKLNQQIHKLNNTIIELTNEKSELNNKLIQKENQINLLQQNIINLENEMVKLKEENVQLKNSVDVSNGDNIGQQEQEQKQEREEKESKSNDVGVVVGVQRNIHDASGVASETSDQPASNRRRMNSNDDNETQMKSINFTSNNNNLRMRRRENIKNQLSLQWERMKNEKDVMDGKKDLAEYLPSNAIISMELKKHILKNGGTLEENGFNGTTFKFTLLDEIDSKSNREVYQQIEKGLTNGERYSLSTLKKLNKKLRFVNDNEINESDDDTVDVD